MAVKKIYLWLLLITAIGCQSLEDNLQKLKSPYAKDRVEAMDWLCHNSDNTEANRKLLKAALQYDRDGNPQEKSEVVRSLAVRLMALDENVEYVPILKRLLTQIPDPKFPDKNRPLEKSPLVRMEAVQALGSLKAMGAIPDIVKRLDIRTEPDLWVRLKVLKTIGYLKAEQTVPQLVMALDDPESAVDFQALALLEKFTGEKKGTTKEHWKEYLLNEDY